MASTASTPADRRESAPRLDGLLDLYERERSMYHEILELSRRQGEAIRTGQDLAAVRTLLERKRMMLDMRTHMEAGHAQARRMWAEQKHRLTGETAGRLQRLLGTVGGLLEEILQVEAENDHLLLNLAQGA